MRKKSFCYYAMLLASLSVCVNGFCAETGQNTNVEEVDSAIAGLKQRIADSKITNQEECECRLQLLDLQKSNYVRSREKEVPADTDLIASYFENALIIEKRCVGNMGVPYNRYDLVAGSGCFDQMQKDLLAEYDYIVRCRIENPEQPSACYFYLRHEDALDAFKGKMEVKTLKLFNEIKDKSR